MTAERDRREAGTAPTPARAPEIYGRWARYVHDARAALAPDAAVAEIVAHAAARWREHEPPELGFVPDEVQRIVREERHDPAGAAFLDRIVSGEATALRRKADGAIVYVPPDRLATMPPAERATYEPYDPMLARALRLHALEREVEAADRERE